MFIRNISFFISWEFAFYLRRNNILAIEQTNYILNMWDIRYEKVKCSTAGLSEFKLVENDG